MVKENYPIKARTKQGITKVLCVLSALALPLPAFAAVNADAKAEQNLEFSMATPVKKSYKLVGAVVDAKTNESVIGATVMIKGTSKGAMTDIDGKFELTVKPGDTLVISFLGYTSKTIRVRGQKVVSVRLSEDAKALGEVVVTAFGTGQKKETVTGSIQTVRPADLKIPTANLSSAFAGRLAGVISTQSSGAPGKGGSEFFIRGISSTTVSSPLIILDGVEISSNDLNALDPEVIDSFSILKDATATAMYGTRGANGVMIIKTKTGSDLDRPIIGFRLESYINTPTGLPKFVGAEQFMNMFNEAAINEQSGAKLYSASKIKNTLLGKNKYAYPNVDWYDELFREQSFNQKANFNVRGGTSKITYFMNMNMVHETGMLKPRSKDFYSYDNSEDYMKYAFQNNIDYNMSPTSKLALHLNVQLQNTHGPKKGMQTIFNYVRDANPVDFPIIFDNEGDEWKHWGNGAKIGNDRPHNPVAEAVSGYSDTFESTVMANLNFDQKLDFITEGLSFKALVSFKNWSSTTKSREQGINPYQYQEVFNGNGQVSYKQKYVNNGNPSATTLNFKSNTNGDRRYYLQAYFDYNRSFGDHNVSAMLLYNQDEFNSNVLQDDHLKEGLPKRRMGYAFRASYDYDHRYMVELNAGLNGSEKFAEGHRFGFFPSLSLGWNVSQEEFWGGMKDYINTFKLRASYGLVGDDNVARFSYMQDMTLTGGPGYKTGYNNQNTEHSGYKLTRVGNPSISWEVGEKLNIGADLKLFKSLNITADYFREIRRDIFQKNGDIPSMLGLKGAELWGNYASIENSGFDISADYGKQIGSDWFVQFKGTFTYAHNEVLEWSEPAGLPAHQSQIGRSQRVALGFQADGLYIDDADIARSPENTVNKLKIGPGDIKFVDQPSLGKPNGDGQITDEDKVPLGYPTTPEIMYGFGPSVQYKNFDFSFFFQGRARVSLMMSGFAPFGVSNRRNVLQWIADDYWSRDNQNYNAAFPRLLLNDTAKNSNYQASSYWLRDASFLRLKTAEIGYKFKNARVYLSGTNLFVISPFKHWDPEMGGGAGLSYPLQRTFNLGLQVTFK